MGVSINLKKALDRFTLDVAWEVGNELAVIFGPSGSGKSITLQLMTGLMKPDYGFIRVNGKTFFDSTMKNAVPPQNRSFGYVFQDLALFPHMTVRQNIQYGANGIDRTQKAKRVKEIVGIFHLDGLEEKFPAEISGGQRQRVALARALIRNPDVLLLDEPFNALDTSLRWELRNMLRNIRAEFSVPVIMVTHDIFDACALADKVIVYRDGKVVQTGKPQEIFKLQPLDEGVRSLDIFQSCPGDVTGLMGVEHQRDVVKTVAVVKGGGDVGTGVAHVLHRNGFAVLVLEHESPTVIRRKVAFAQALFDGETLVERVRAKRAYTKEEIYSIWDQGNIPVLVDPKGSIVEEIKPHVFIDATLAKRNTGMHRGAAPITIALGPGFKAGEDADAVIETNRGENLGRIIFEGYAEPNTGIPAPVLGCTTERVLRAPCSGRVRHVVDIGGTVETGDAVCYIGSELVKAPLDGVVRGLIAEGMEVSEGLKIGDIDPRGIREACFTISDKARTIGEAVLEAIRVIKSRTLIK